MVKAILSTVVLVLPLVSDAAVVPLYRNPESSFTSGHVRQKELKKSTQALKEYWWFLAELSNQKKYWIPASSLFLPRSFTDQNYSENQRAFIPQQARLNIAIAKDGTLLLKSPQDQSRVLATLNSGTRLKIVSAHQKWLKVLFDGKVEGYVYAEQTLTGLPFLKKEKKTYRDLIQPNNIRPNLAFTNDTSSWGFLTPSFQNLKKVRIQSFSLVQLHNRQLEIWAMANLKLHGKVWWNSAHLQNLTNTETIESLADRPVYDIASQEVPPYKTFVSAKGVFTSSNKGWKKIKKFKDQNYPIAIAENGVIFVGSQVSTDHGETFEPYIHWTQVLKGLHKTTLSRFQIQNIEIRDGIGNEILLTAQIKKKTRQLYTHNRGKSWTLIR